MPSNSGHRLFGGSRTSKLSDYIVRIEETYPGGDTKRTSWVITAYNAAGAKDTATSYAARMTSARVVSKPERVSSLASSHGAGEMHPLR